MECAKCNKQIEGTYYSCLDNFLQTKYFDTEKENIFCSKECFCEYVTLEEIERGV